LGSPERVLVTVNLAACSCPETSHKCEAGGSRIKSLRRRTLLWWLCQGQRRFGGRCLLSARPMIAAFSSWLSSRLDGDAGE
jgi:hypothetical protein